MTLQVEIGKQNTDQIISAIKLLKGVKSVSEQGLKQGRGVKKCAKKQWLLEARDMEQNPHKYKAYSDVDEMFRDILK